MVIPVWGVFGSLCALVAVSMIIVLGDEARGGSRFARQERAAELVRRWAASGLAADLDRCAARLHRRAWRSTMAVAFGDVAAVRPDLRARLAESRRTHRALERWVMREIADRDAGRRARAIEVAGALRLHAALPAIRLASIDAVPTTRVAACEAMFALDDSGASAVLLRLLEEDGSWALALLEADVDGVDAGLGRRRMDVWGATPALARLDDLGRRRAAGRMLLADQLPSASTGLVPLATGDESGLLGASGPAVRAAALRSLYGRNLESQVGRVVELFADDNDNVRVAALDATCRLDRSDRLHAPVLVAAAALLGDPSRVVRSAAAEALRGAPSGRDALGVLRASVDSVVAEIALTALWNPAEAEALPMAVAAVVA